MNFKKLFCYHLFLLIFLGFGKVFSQTLKIKITPTIGCAEGFFKYTNKINKFYIQKYKYNYNPFTPTDLQFGIKSEIAINKLNVSIGLETGFSSYSYTTTMVGVLKVDTFPNGNIVSLVHSVVLNKESNRPALRIPMYITFPILNENSVNKLLNGSENISTIENYKKSKLKIKPYFFSGLSLLQLKYPGSYDGNDNNYYNFDFITNADTNSISTYETVKNAWGCSLDGGISLKFIKNYNEWLRFNVRYEQGLIPLYILHLTFANNSIVKYSNSVISSGSRAYFGFSFPINVYKNN